MHLLDLVEYLDPLQKMHGMKIYCLAGRHFWPIKEDMVVQVTQLRSKIQAAQLEYSRLLAEAQSLDLTGNEVELYLLLQSSLDSLV